MTQGPREGDWERQVNELQCVPPKQCYYRIGILHTIKGLNVGVDKSTNKVGATGDLIVYAWAILCEWGVFPI